MNFIHFLTFKKKKFKGKNPYDDSYLNYSNHQNLAGKFQYAALQQQLQLQHHQHMQQQHQQSQSDLLNAGSSSSADTKVRKRSANQAYEYLISLPDSKTFQDWLSTNETDFTWVHKRNSMTNAGKKYYYICNYRIKKGYTRCPAVIYALFPNTNDTTVMVYSCGDHEHSRLNGAPICGSGGGGNGSSSNQNNANTSNDWTNSISSSTSKQQQQQQQQQQKNANVFSVSPTQSQMLMDSVSQQSANFQANKLTKQKSSGNLNVNSLVTSIVNSLQCQRTK